MTNHDLVRTILDRSRAHCSMDVPEQLRALWIQSDELIFEEMIGSCPDEVARHFINTAGELYRNLLHEAMMSTIAKRGSKE